MVEQVIFKVVMLLIPLIVAITVHEFAHIAMAKWLGDDLGTRLGRFSLDPLRHIDPIWTVALPGALIAMSVLSGGANIPFIAAGKPSPYNPDGLTRKFFGKPIRLRTAELLIAIVGPLSNLILAFLSMVVMYIMTRFGYNDFTQYSAANLLIQFTYLNVALFVFNLIPVPPLDGTKIVLAFLPHNLAQRYEAVSMQLSWVLLGLLIFGGTSLIGSVVHSVVSGMTWILMH